MRICFLCADLGIALGGRKGAAAHARGLIGAFRAAGHEVVAVTGLPADPGEVGASVVALEGSALAEQLEGALDLPLRRALRHVLHNAVVERGLRELLARSRPDLVYERYGPFGVAGGVVARALGIPHVLEVNAPLAREGAEYRGQALPELAAQLERAALAVTRRVVAVSETLRAELCEAGADPSKIAVVPNGVDTERFQPSGPVLPGLEGRFVVGFVGNLRPWHGVEALAKAFRELLPDPRFQLLVVGDGPAASALESLEREVPDRVRLVRGVDHAEVPRYLRAMDAAVAPYPPLERFYFSPLKLLEYMAAGRAIVASRIGQVAELLRDGETGLLVPPGDPSALAAAVRRLADDDRLRARLGARAAETARREHTWEDRAARILDLARSAT